MSYEEKGTWNYLVVAIVGYSTYLVLVFSQAGGRPVSEVDYVPAMLWTIGGAIVGAIVLRIVVEIVSPSESRKGDVRDKEIGHFGDSGGNAMLVFGALGALVLAWFEAPHFWIANVIYLGFVLSAILSSLMKLSAYHRGIPQW